MNQPSDDRFPQGTQDPALDTLLSALANAEPAPGFADRLTATLQSRAEQKDSAVPQGFLSFPKGIRVSPNPAQMFLPWLATVAAVAACLLFVLLPRTHSPFVPHTVATAQQASIPKSQPVSAPQETPTPLIHLALATHTSAQKTTIPRRSPPVLTAESKFDQQAVDDLHSPSQPAPPLPPTQQERLVALMLRRGERHDLAQLETGKQEFTLKQERVAFGQFFDPPEDPAIRNQPRSLATEASQLGR